MAAEDIYIGVSSDDLKVAADYLAKGVRETRRYDARVVLRKHLSAIEKELRARGAL